MKKLYGKYKLGSNITFKSEANHQNTFDGGDYILQFCGKINNFEELKKEFRQTNLRDEEIIIELFRRYDVNKAIELLDGAFAFALFNKYEKSLILTRDRMAQVPLFYTVLNNNIIFSSSINEILKTTKLKREFDLESTLTYLSSNKWVNPEKTHFKDIYMVEHGTYLKCNENGLYKKSYYNYYTDSRYDEDEVLARLDKYFMNYVNKIAKDYQNISASLSGGLDSSLVSQLFNERNRLSKSYTISYPNEDNIDSGYAELLAHEKKIELEKVTLSGNDFDLQKIDQLLSILQEIPFDPTSMGDLLIRRKAKNDNNDLILTGNGSDEMWMGYLNVCQSNVFNTDMNLEIITKNYLNSAFFSSKWNIELYDIAYSAVKDTIQKYLINQFNGDKYNALAIYAIKTILNLNNTQEHNFSENLGLDIIMPFVSSNNLTLLPFTISGIDKVKDGKPKYLLRKYAKTKSLPNKIITRSKLPYPIPKLDVNHKIKQLCEQNWSSIANSTIINTIVRKDSLRNSTVENFNYRELWFLLMYWRFEQLYQLDTGFQTKDLRRSSQNSLDLHRVTKKIEATYLLKKDPKTITL